MPKTTRPAPTTPAGTNLNDGTEKIRRWYQIGQESLKMRPGAAAHGSAALEEEAGRLGIGAEMLRKLRQFADPERGYTTERLETLCRESIQAKRPLGITFIMRLVSIPDLDLRGELQRRVFTEKWSCIRLNREILMRLGRQRSGGRRATITTDPHGVLAQIDSMIEPWTRWHRRMTAGKDSGEPLPVLPSEVSAGVAQVVEAMKALRVVIASEVEKIKKGEVLPESTGNE